MGCTSVRLLPFLPIDLEGLSLLIMLAISLSYLYYKALIFKNMFLDLAELFKNITPDVSVSIGITRNVIRANFDSKYYFNELEIKKKTASKRNSVQITALTYLPTELTLTANIKAVSCTVIQEKLEKESLYDAIKCCYYYKTNDEELLRKVFSSDSLKESFKSLTCVELLEIKNNQNNFSKIKIIVYKMDFNLVLRTIQFIEILIKELTNKEKNFLTKELERYVDEL